MTSLHELTQQKILESCLSMGLQAQMEYRGNGWRADVLAYNEKKKFAFEVQLSPQTLRKTQERQEKYIRDGINGCWLFEKEPSKHHQELEQLPIFKLIENNNSIFVSLKGRKTLPIDVFVKDFINDRIKFCHTINPLPQITVVFLEYPCWKCGALNHIFYLGPFHTACNIEIRHEEAMWATEKFSFRPEILNKINEYAASEQGKHLKLATIKNRYSGTMDKTYMSFGCNRCDSIFGDFYVWETIYEFIYETSKDEFTFDVDFDLDMRQEIPHWCHPGEHPFCE